MSENAIIDFEAHFNLCIFFTKNLVVFTKGTVPRTTRKGEELRIEENFPLIPLVFSLCVPPQNLDIEHIYEKDLF